MIAMSTTHRLYERGEARWEEAWAALIDHGHNPDDYMYMHSEDRLVCGNDSAERKVEAHAFKHVETRKYVWVNTIPHAKEVTAPQTPARDPVTLGGITGEMDFTMQPGTPRLLVRMDRLAVCTTLGNVQLSLRHPDNSGASSGPARDFCRALASWLILNWNPEDGDVNRMIDDLTRDGIDGLRAN